MSKLWTMLKAVCWPPAMIAMASTLGVPGFAIAAPAPPANWPAIVDQYLGHELRDPYSAVKTVTRAPRFMVYKPFLLAKPREGWAVCYSINAKNAFGGFIGVRTHYFIISGETVIAHVEDQDFSTRIDVRLECEQPADVPAGAGTAP